MNVYSFLVCMFLALGLMGVLTPTSLFARSGSLPAPGFPQSCGVQLKTHNWTAQTLDKAYALGFRVVRRGFYWQTIEPQAGVYDFSKYDAQMNHARDLGLTVVACLFGNNPIHEDDDRGGIQTEAGRQAFARFAAALAERYKDHDVIWEVWNEPNIRTFWRKDGTHNSEPFAKEYTDLVKAVAPAMLKADPDAIIAAGSVSAYWEPSFQWTEFCFRHGILDSGIRAWSVHPYGVRTPEEHLIGHQRVRDLMEQYGHPDMPMIDSERGFALKELVNNEGWAGGDIERAHIYQAWHLVRQFLVDQMFGLPLTVWYEWDGKDPWTGEAFALVNAEKDLPVYHAARVMFEQMDGYAFDQRIDADDPHVYLTVWTNDENARKLVAWCAPVPGGPPDEAGEKVVVLETDATPSLTTVDLSGASRPLARGIALTLTGAPQYVQMPSNMEVLGAQVIAHHRPQAAHSMAQTPQGAVDLGIFAPGTNWKFVKNTGEGSFELATADDGKAMGVLQYDFTNSQGNSRPYVMAFAPVDIRAGATEVVLYARSPIAQQLTFRLIDSTEQTLQAKRRITGTGEWEQISIPLTRKLEHWGGANDGKPHFPIERIALSLPEPRDGTKTGKVEYTSAAAVYAGGSVPPAPITGPAPNATTTPAANQAAPGDLNVFARSQPWKFIRNTGEGSFELKQDDAGNPIGVMQYDFSNSNARSTPYVLAMTETNIPAGKQFSMQVLTPIKQQLTFRFVDSTGQTLQFKKVMQADGDWQTISVPLDGKFEHWDGANDGFVHFPIQRIVLSVPRPSEEHKVGQVGYARATVE